MEHIKYLTQSYVKPGMAGYCAVIRNITSKWHTHDFYEAFFVINGTSKHLTNDMVYELVPGSLGFIRPKEAHRYEAKNCILFNLILPTDTMDQIISYLGNNSAMEELIFSNDPVHRNLSQQGYDALLMSFEQFMLLTHNDLCEYNTGFKLVALAFFEKLFYDKTVLYESLYPAWMNALLSEMQKEENYSRGLKAMQEISMYTHEHICRSIKKYMHVTPTELLNNIRIKEASKMLIYTDLPIVDISEKTGFDTLSNFYHRFKETHNISPMKYRKEHQFDADDIT